MNAAANGASPAFPVVGPTSAAPVPAVSCERDGSVAVLTLANPPVNGLGLEMRLALLDAIVRAESSEDITTIVLRGSERMFCGGADIRQFGTPKARQAPLLRDVNRTIEAATKPVIAAIHGYALGAGLELAMSCHWRIAAAGSRFGQPEVKLGFVPGGGGTQRLPRLVGLEQATWLITRGEPIDTDRALACGLIDRVDTADLLEAALRFAGEVADMSPAGRITSRRAPTWRFPDGAAAFFASARERLGRDDGPNRKAVLECVRCVEASTQLVFEAGLDLERAAFDELVASEESVRARRAFFSARSSAGSTPFHGRNH